jgi:hypothetical protein
MTPILPYFTHLAQGIAKEKMESKKRHGAKFFLRS